jgi:hypothetical protein
MSFYLIVCQIYSIAKNEQKDEEYFQAMLKVAEQEISTSSQVARPDSMETPIRNRFATPSKASTTTKKTKPSSLLTRLLSPIQEGEGAKKTLFHNTEEEQDEDDGSKTTMTTTSVFYYDRNSKAKSIKRIDEDVDDVEDVVLIQDTPVVLKSDGTVTVYTPPQPGFVFGTKSTKSTTLMLPTTTTAAVDNNNTPVTNIYRGQDTLIVQQGPSFHVYGYKTTGVFDYIHTCELPYAVDLAMGRSTVAVLHKIPMMESDHRGGYEMRIELYDMDKVLDGGKKQATTSNGGGSCNPWGRPYSTSVFSSRNRVNGQVFVYGHGGTDNDDDDDDGTTEKVYVFAEDAGGNCKNFKVPTTATTTADGGTSSHMIDGRARWNFNNIDLARATATARFPVVCHHTDGLYYESQGHWYPIELSVGAGTTGSTDDDGSQAKANDSDDDHDDDGSNTDEESSLEPYEIVGGDGVILAWKGSTLTFISEGNINNDDGKVSFTFHSFDLALADDDTGKTSIVAADGTNESCVIVVQTESVNDEDIGSKMKDVKGAAPCVGKTG